MAIRRKYVAALLTGFTLVAGTPRSGFATFAAVDAACRQALATGASKYAQAINKEKSKCFKSYFKGSFLADTDCNSDPLGLVKATKARQKFHKLVQDKCDNAVGHADPQHNGYVVCAEPCQFIAIGSLYAEADVFDIPADADSTTVAGCITCLVDDHSKTTFQTIYGNNAGHNLHSLLKDEAKCLNTIGKGLGKYFKTRTEIQFPCQEAEDIADTATDCKEISPAATVDPNAKIATALQKVKDKIGKACSSAILGSLHSCSTDLATEKDCVGDAFDTYTDSIFHDLFEAPEVIFVSSATGSPSGDGTILNPTDSINAGMTLAINAGYTDLYIDGFGLYVEKLTLQSGLNLRGGYNSANAWVHDGTLTQVLSPEPEGVIGTNVSNTTVQELSISASGTTALGASSYGVHLINPSNVVFKDCSISASDAGNGSNGSNGITGADGVNGSSAGSGCVNSTTACSTCGQPGGGAGGVNSSCSSGSTGGAGGNGGHCSASAPSINGQPGSGTSFGAGGTGGASCHGIPTAGSDAGSVSNGSNGTAGATFGGSGTSYTPANGGSGTSGGSGSGGGGGGGGGGGDNQCDSFGGGGGGGGSGGCGGTFATGGTGAGGSFGVWISGGSASFDACSITTATGGTGGVGGTGGTGGGGGTGGIGGSGQDDSIGGQNGGHGGNGGSGGHGGGGGGGPSIGIVCSSGAAVSRTNNTITTGNGGGGGSSAGTTGSTGQKTNERGC